MTPKLFAAALLLLLVRGAVFAQQLPLGYPCEILGSNTPENATDCTNQLTPLCFGEKTDRYRTIDGTCNNLKMDRRWGSAGSRFDRLVPRRSLEVMGYPPAFKVRKTNRYLRHARKISILLHSGSDRTYDQFTSMVMQFGQFLDHDITLTPGKLF